MRAANGTLELTKALDTMYLEGAVCVFSLGPFLTQCVFYMQGSVVLCISSTLGTNQLIAVAEVDR